MTHYRLLSWEGTIPRNTGKGVVVLSGQNLIRVYAPDKTRSLKTRIWRDTVYIPRRAQDRLLKHLQKTKHADFKFMKVIDLTI